METRTVTAVVQETLTVRKTITVEVGRDDTTGDAKDRLRKVFSDGLRVLSATGCDVVASEGVDYFRTETDADNNNSYDPDDDEDDAAGALT